MSRQDHEFIMAPGLAINSDVCVGLANRKKFMLVAISIYLFSLQSWRIFTEIYNISYHHIIEAAAHLTNSDCLNTYIHMLKQFGYYIEFISIPNVVVHLTFVPNSIN